MKQRKSLYQKQLYYEDIEIGMEIPCVVKNVTHSQIIKWAEAVRDYYPVHIWRDFAIREGLPGIIAHGWLTVSFLCQMVTDWIGVGADLKELSSSHRDMVFPGDRVSCRGKVIKQYIQDGKCFIDCEVWAETERRGTVCAGDAVVVLPHRANI